MSEKIKINEVTQPIDWNDESTKILLRSYIEITGNKETESKKFLEVFLRKPMPKSIVDCWNNAIDTVESKIEQSYLFEKGKSNENI